MTRSETLLCGAAMILVGGVLIHSLHLAVDSEIGIDDANITLVYARNLAAGEGFVFNAGGERVEGSSSMLWTLLCALIYYLGGREAAVGRLSVGCFVLAQAIFVALLATLGKDSANGARAPDSGVDEASRGAPAGHSRWPFFVLYLLLIYSNPGYLLWNTQTLMDVCLWGTAVAAAVWYAAHPPRGAGPLAAAAVVWALMCLVRPDALLVAPAFALIAGWNAAADGVRRGMLVAGTLGASSFLSLGGLTLFRLTYFGYPLPNTYYAKVAPSAWFNLHAGGEYLLGWAGSSPIVLAGLAAAVAWAWSVVARSPAPRRGNEPSNQVGDTAFEAAPAASDRRSMQAIALALLVLCMVPLATGGDHFAEFRFLQPAYPLACLLLAAWARRVGALEWFEEKLTSVGAPAPRAMVVAAAGLFSLYLHAVPWWVYRNVEQPLQLSFSLAQTGRRRGAEIAALFLPPPATPTTPPSGGSPPPLPTLGLFPAGGTGYGYPGVKFDLLGLNTVAMGHSKADRTDGVKNHTAFDPKVFFELRPDLIDCEAADDLFRASRYSRGLIAAPEFEARYAFGRLRRTTAPPASAVLFIHREFLKRLLEGGGGAGLQYEFEPREVKVVGPFEYRATLLDRYFAEVDRKSIRP